MSFTKGNIREGFYTILKSYGFTENLAKILSDKLADVTLASDDVAALSLLNSIAYIYPDADNVADIARGLIHDRKHSAS